MRNIFLFIRQYFNLITFVILQIICIIALSKYSKTHEAFFSVKANEITGKINTKYNGINKYFKLDEVNVQLAKENAELRQKLAQNFVVIDTSKTKFTDTLIKDTLHQTRKYVYLPARVVINSVNMPYNFIQIDRGSNQGIRKDMAVIGPNGVVGKVVAVGANFSEIMSLMNRSSKISAVIKNSKELYASTITWDGKQSNLVTMENVSKAIAVKKGDSILTSSYSASFPSQLLVGTVVEVKTDASGSNYVLKIKTATNFNSIQFVNVIENYFYKEQHSLDSSTLANHIKSIGE